MFLFTHDAPRDQPLKMRDPSKSANRKTLQKTNKKSDPALACDPSYPRTFGRAIRVRVLVIVVTHAAP
jgi:hypothetical protein